MHICENDTAHSKLSKTVRENLKVCFCPLAYVREETPNKSFSQQHSKFKILEEPLYSQNYYHLKVLVFNASKSAAMLCNITVKLVLTCIKYLHGFVLT